MFAMRAEKVERLAAMDWSSPMSAKTPRNGVKRLRRIDGDQQPRLRHQREEADGLERDGLAAGVRARDDEGPHGRHDEQVRPDDKRISEIIFTIFVKMISEIL